MSPVPKAAATLPGAIASSVAMDEACATGCLRWEPSTAGPIPTCRVRSATRASVIHTSAKSAGESKSQTRAKPSCSARAA